MTVPVFKLYPSKPIVHMQFLARDSMLSALYAIARSSVRPSVCHTGGSVKNGWS